MNMVYKYSQAHPMSTQGLPAFHSRRTTHEVFADREQAPFVDFGPCYV